MTSEELFNCDFVGFGSQLEALKTGNELLKQQFSFMQFKLDKQTEVWRNLDKKLDNMSFNIKTIESKMLKASKDHFDKVTDVIHKQNQMVLLKFPPPADDGKWESLIYIKDVLKSHSVLFEGFGGNLKNIESNLNRINEENHYQNLNEGVLKNFRILEHVDKKLFSIENVIENKEQSHSQYLNESIRILKQVDNKLLSHESASSLFKNLGEKLNSNERNLIKTYEAKHTTASDSILKNFQILNKIDNSLSIIGNAVTVFEYNEKNHTHQVSDSISKNFKILENIDKKLKDLENAASSHETNGDKRARNLSDSIIKNLGVLEKVNKKLFSIENVIENKEHSHSQYLNETIRILKQVDNKLLSHENASLLFKNLGETLNSNEKNLIKTYEAKHITASDSILRNFQILNKIDNNLSVIGNAVTLFDNSEKNHSLQVSDSISKNSKMLENIEKKLKDLENAASSHETNGDKRARNLSDNIIKNLGVLEKVDKKLFSIENVIENKEQSHSQYLNETIRILKQVDNKLLSHENASLLFKNLGEKLNSNERNLIKTYEAKHITASDSILKNFKILNKIDNNLSIIGNAVTGFEYNEKNHTRQVSDGISKNFKILENIDKKLKDLENAASSHETNGDKRARNLSDSIIKNLGVLENLKDIMLHNFRAWENVDKKLISIRTISATKETQIALNKTLEKYISKSDSAKICVQGKEKLVCTAEFYPKSCADYNDKYCSDSTCRIYNHQFAADPFLVSCDNKSHGGGWTVIQRRMDGSVDFYRDWSEYKKGFGNIEGEFFIGLDKLNALTTTLKPVELLIQLLDFNNTEQYGKYDEFEVGNESENYKLKKVGKHSGNADDCLLEHQGYGFSTKDRDHDIMEAINCAEYCHGGWWYYECSRSNLNGKYYKGGNIGNATDGIHCGCRSESFSYSLKFTQMSIRPKRK